MSKQTRKSISELIDRLKKSIKNSVPKTTESKYPGYLDHTRLLNKIIIEQKLEVLQGRYSELFPFIEALKAKIPDIIENTHLCAVYLLLCYNLQTWKSLFLLAKYGHYSAIMSLIRKLKEISMLVQHFTLEKKDNIRTDLDKWFSGEIISHSIGRNSSTKLMESDNPYPELDYGKLQSFIYQIESQAPHAGYASILECISPFTEDFDFNGYAGYGRTISALEYANGTMNDINLALKAVYSLILNDPIGYEKIDQILLKYDPSMKRTTIDQAILDQFKKDNP